MTAHDQNEHTALLTTTTTTTTSTQQPVDRALDHIGMGAYHVYLIALTGLAWTAESMEMLLLSFIKQPLQCHWRISDAQAALITTAVAVGMLLGAYVWGRLADAHGRRPAFLACTATTFVCGLLSALAPSYRAILLARAAVGFGVGGVPVSFSVLMEFLPAASRGYWGMAISLFWALGAIFEAAVAMRVLPVLGWRNLILISSLPLLLVLLMSVFLFESPRWLATHARHHHAAHVLSRVAAINRAHLPDSSLAAVTAPPSSSSSSASASNSASPSPTPSPRKSPISQLFVHPRVRLLTVTVFIMWFAAAFVYYALVMLQPEMLAAASTSPANCPSSTSASAPPAPVPPLQPAPQPAPPTTTTRTSAALSHAVDACHHQLTRADFASAFWASVGELPGILLALITIDLIGRRPVIAYTFAIAAISCILLQLCISRAYQTLLFFVARGASAGAFQAVYLYTNEVYAADLRATAMGISSAVARVGLMISPLVAQYLANVSLVSALWSLFAIAFAAVAASIALQVETTGRPMLQSTPDLVAALSAGKPLAGLFHRDTLFSDTTIIRWLRWRSHTHHESFPELPRHVSLVQRPQQQTTNSSNTM